VGDLDRAHDFANKVDEPAVWSELGHAYLDAGNAPDAIASYLRSQDGSRYAQVGEVWGWSRWGWGCGGV